MAQTRRATTRGLQQVPRGIPADEAAAVRRVRRRERIRYRLFTLGLGLDMPMLFIILVLMAFGLVMLFSASYAYSYYENNGNSYHYVLRQGFFALFGIFAMLLISTVDYHQLHKLNILVSVVSCGLLLAVFFLRGTSIAPIKGGANRWINIAGLEFQPSEIAKFAMILMFAHFIALNGEKMKTARYGFWPFMGRLGIFAGLIIIEKHVSATVIICMIAAMMMIIGGTPLRYFVGIGVLAGVALTCLLMFSDKFAYALNRVKGWLDPFNPPEGVDTWQTRQSLYAIGSGQLLGVGIGQSRQKYLYLPEPQNDFIFAIVCEELGFIGALLVIILFALFIWRGVYISLNARDRFGMMLGLGITFQFGLQAILNICVVTNTIPNTGISLPFFSYGGTALLMLLAEMGVLLSISRHSRIDKT